MANHTSNKGLASRLYKEFLKLNSKKYNPVTKTGKTLEETFHWRGQAEGNTHMKSRSTLLAIREIPSKIGMRFHYTLTRMTK